MTQLSKERLEEIAELANIGSLECMSFPASHAEVAEMAHRLLAVEGQEPVAYWRKAFTVDGFCYADGINAKKYHDTHPLSQSTDGRYWTVTPLYAAPQPAPVAPPVQVPDEVLRQLLPDVEKADFWFEHEGNTFFEGVKFNDAVFEACRAAMLQPSSVALQLPEGYVLVPVEPTHDMLKAWLSEVAKWRGHVTGYKAMLAAAPQQQTAQQNIPQWIPCSERMPESKPGSYEYLVYETLNNQVQHDYWNTPDTDYIEPLLSSWNHYGNYVTHWMPLPEAPQEPTK